MTTLRRFAWEVGAPVRWGLIRLIHGYRVVASPFLGGQCRFYPSCSRYAEDAIRLRGAIRGTALATWRILRCNPFGRGGVEHVTGGAWYDAVIHTDGQRRVAHGEVPAG